MQHPNPVAMLSIVVKASSSNPMMRAWAFRKSIHLGLGPTKGLRGLTAGLSVLQSRILSRMKAGSALGCSAGSSDADAPTGCCASPVQMMNLSLTRARAVGGCQTINPSS